MEMVIAMAIMAIVCAVLVPQLRAISSGWDSRTGAAETLQNGRILIDHLNRNLSKAARITAVSDSGTANGYIEFVDNDANSFRYDVNSISSYVEFGLIVSLSDLAGPVSQLQFTCYDALDLDTPITDVNSIRSVKVETTRI
jgi:type II secretory pathway pseudopilin PulG